ncbi:hypothetical protein DFH09DRAFT_1309453 [Mycena vulgaris]|nr:hypothetical protein DFH09DRAFT_1309453 [Mycena vulgaris]
MPVLVLAPRLLAYLRLHAHRPHQSAALPSVRVAPSINGLPRPAPWPPCPIPAPKSLLPVPSFAARRLATSRSLILSPPYHNLFPCDSPSHHPAVPPAVSPGVPHFLLFLGPSDPPGSSPPRSAARRRLPAAAHCLPAAARRLPAAARHLSATACYTPPSLIFLAGHGSRPLAPSYALRPAAPRRAAPPSHAGHVLTANMSVLPLRPAAPPPRSTAPRRATPSRALPRLAAPACPVISHLYTPPLGK